MTANAVSLPQGLMKCWCLVETQSRILNYLLIQNQHTLSLGPGGITADRDMATKPSNDDQWHKKFRVCECLKE